MVRVNPRISKHVALVIVRIVIALAIRAFVNLGAPTTIEQG